MKTLVAVVSLTLAATGSVCEQRIAPEGLLADLEIAREAYTTLHPGLYRYNTPEQMEAQFGRLRERLAKGLSLREVYLAFAELLAAIRCGHTFANFWNQSDKVKEQLFRGADKIPFTFRIIDDRLVVTGSAVDDPRVRPGTEIMAIDQVPMGTLLDRLMTLMHADGSADHQRRFELQLTGIGEFEPFDVYQPLLYPPAQGRYHFSALDPGSGEPFSFSARAMSREQRRTRLEERHGPLASSPDELWRFELLDDATAYLKAGSFVTWKMELDWRRFLDDAFTTLRERQIGNLILDVRGNSGGDNEVLAVLASHLVTEPITLPARRELLRYERVPALLLPHLDTWDRSFLDRSGQVRPAGDGFYTWKEASLEPTVVPGSPGAYTGKLYLLVDPANSSATFTLARVLKDTGLATLVGQPTGGNRRGINGGQILFLRLPNSGIEMDLPLIGYFPVDEQPDSGVVPDVLVTPRLDDVARGVDTVLEATLRLIACDASEQDHDR